MRRTSLGPIASPLTDAAYEESLPVKLPTPHRMKTAMMIQNRILIVAPWAWRRM